MNAIEVINLTKKFDGFSAVDNVSFSVSRGEIFAFLGPNGAGKTTIIKMLTTLLKPTSGEMRLGGINPVRQQEKARATFGIVFQDQSLDDELTARENMEFHAVLYGIGKIERKKRTEELLKFIGLWERADDLVKTFSGGMRRRLEIARGFMHQPEILFLDEPTLGLDPQTRNHIWNHIKKLNQAGGVTVFFTTHHMEEAERAASRIAIIDNGKIIAIGSTEDLKEKTNTRSLEDAFIALTGRDIREETVSGMDRMRSFHKAWRRK